MPKTVNGLFDEVVSWDNLLAAYHDARKGKRHKPDVSRFHRRWEERVLDLHNHLAWGSWEPSPFSAFPVFEPKHRLIEAPPFHDRVVHHAIHRVVEPHFERRFIDHSYACRKGKGTHQCIFAVQRMLRRAQAKWGDVYVLQGDIASYFPSIHQPTLIRKLERVIGDKRLMSLWRQIIDGQGDGDTGIPIGALTSQLSANVYLDSLDHYVTDDLGFGFYARYMDDWIIMGPSKSAMWALLEHLRGWLRAELHLTVNRKSTVYPAARGVDFAGYRTWTTHILPRKSNVKRARVRLKAIAKRGDYDKLAASWASFAGYMKHCRGGVGQAEIFNEIAEAA